MGDAEVDGLAEDGRRALVVGGRFHHPSRNLLDRISDKGVALVLAGLGSGADCAGEPRPMRGLKMWARTHMDDVFAGRATYDRRDRPAG